MRCWIPVSIDSFPGKVILVLPCHQDTFVHYLVGYKGTGISADLSEKPSSTDTPMAKSKEE